MRNHFIVVTLFELKKSQARAVIRDPVRCFQAALKCTYSHSDNIVPRGARRCL